MAGPLAGIEAGLASVPAGWMMVLACDMPHVDSRLFARMIARCRERDLDVCWLESPRGIEPLCGVYHTRTSSAVQSALRSGRRKVTDILEHDIEIGTATRKPRVEAWRDDLESLGGDAPLDSAVNVNTPQDLAGIERSHPERHAPPRTGRREQRTGRTDSDADRQSERGHA